jgi:hypothetical protein
VVLTSVAANVAINAAQRARRLALPKLVFAVFMNFQWLSITSSYAAHAETVLPAPAPAPAPAPWALLRLFFS